MNDYWTKYYKSLEGATITKFSGMHEADEYGDGFPAYFVTFADGSEGVIEISRDPEGNGGGFIFGLQQPTD